jgi:hypothetical protein
VGTGKTVTSTTSRSAARQASNYALSATTRDDDGEHHGGDADAGDHGDQQDLRRHVERGDRLHADGCRRQRRRDLQRHRQLRHGGGRHGQDGHQRHLALGGAAASNYALSATTATTTANITAATLTPAITATNKTYDGTSSATISCTLTGVVGTDVVSCSGTGSFASAAVGTGKTVTSSNLVLGGAQAGNYALSATTATTTANITAATLTPAITASNKTYDGTSAAAISCTLTGVVGSGRGQLQRHGQLRLCRGRHGQDGQQHRSQPGRRAGRQLRAVGDDRDDDGEHHRGDADAGDYGDEQDLRRTRRARRSACTPDGCRRQRPGQLQRHRQLRLRIGRDGARRSQQQPGARRRGGEQLCAVRHDGDDDGEHHGGDADAGDHREEQDLRRDLGGDIALHADGVRRQRRRELQRHGQLRHGRGRDGKTVTSSNLALGGAAASNYALSATTRDDDGEHHGRDADAGDHGDEQDLRRHVERAIACTLTGVVGTDVVSCSGTGSFDSAAVGTGKTVTSSNLALGGAQASNYALSATTATTTANITAATLTPAITASEQDLRRDVERGNRLHADRAWSAATS